MLKARSITFICSYQNYESARPTLSHDSKSLTIRTDEGGSISTEISFRRMMWICPFRV
jgi:hypothetical protein